MRTFIAIEIPGSIRETIAEHIDTFKTVKQPVKWVPYRNLHITLKFLGEISEEIRTEMKPILQETAGCQKPFKMNLKNFGCFPNARRPRVVWSGVDQGSDELTMLARDIEKAVARCGFTEEGRFHPHLTIGRIKKRCSIDHILQKEFVSDAFAVNGFVLFKSTLTPQGAEYKALDTFSF